jgi:hypothetical protein
MKTMILTALTTASSLLASFCVHASPTCSYQQNPAQAAQSGPSSRLGGATFVRTSGQSGYFVVEPGSNAVDTLGLADAPYRDADNIGRTGMGNDVVAFRFDAAGRLEGYPVYISQSRPDSFYTSRLAMLAPRHTTLADVKTLFSSDTVRVKKQGAHTLAYLEVPVYDPLASGD